MVIETDGCYRCKVSDKELLFPAVSDQADMTAISLTNGPCLFFSPCLIMPAWQSLVSRLLVFISKRLHEPTHRDSVDKAPKCLATRCNVLQCDAMWDIPISSDTTTWSIPVPEARTEAFRNSLLLLTQLNALLESTPLCDWFAWWWMGQYIVNAEAMDDCCNTYNLFGAVKQSLVDSLSFRRYWLVL